MPVYFHVGMPKSASTAFQKALEHSTDRNFNYVNCGVPCKLHSNITPLQYFFQKPKKFKGLFYKKNKINVYSCEAFLGSAYENFELTNPFISTAKALFDNVKLIFFTRSPTTYLPSLYIQAVHKGYSKNYTLRIAPKSHKINHSVAFKKNSKITPVISKKYENKFSFIRPNMKKGEVMIINPNLLHGGSTNKGSKSRVSLDIRAINLKKIKNIVN